MSRPGPRGTKVTLAFPTQVPEADHAAARATVIESRWQLAFR